FAALRGLSFDLAKGEMLAVMGPSGCGKSTLLNIVGLLDSPNSGRYFLRGKDVSSLDDYQRTLLRRTDIGFIFQSFHLLPHFSTLDNVALPMLYAGTPSSEMKHRASELLGLVGLGGQEKKTPLQLSGGERQRVAVARALANKPKLLLADEPTGNLDSATSAEVIALLKKVCAESGSAMLIVTHDPEVARKADRNIKIRDGQVVA
ncbi:MAG TPA: ABC transporter ATP-binding protein, partial [Elusimicrobiales bacterium]|nr:ABC transporter ATP-binding protein [Elusimicrobiales bacterium]